MTEIERTRTPEPDDGDAAEHAQKTGTQGEDERDAQSREPDWKTLYLESKGKIEEANSLKAKVAELESRHEQPPAARATEADEAYWENVEQWAAKGDSVARGLLEMRDEKERMAMAMSATYELLDIDDREERRAVAQHIQRNANRNIDVRAARAEVREKKLADENSKLRAQLEAAQKKPPTDVIRTAPREITADRSQNGKETMTQSDYDHKIADLRAQGRHKEALRLSQRLANDELEVKWGQ